MKYLMQKNGKKFKSDKICELAYAKIQGRTELINHFEKSSIMKATDENKKPMLFNPVVIPRIELPIKYCDILKDYYPNCQYLIINNKLVRKEF